MKRNRLFIPTSTNYINADSALPDFMQKSAEDSDSPKTWRETVATYGLSNHAEASALAPLIKITPPNGFVFRGDDDDDLTLEEAMKKGLVPKGMKLAWSPERRKRYETCIEPDLKKYKKAVDKINRHAEEDFYEHKTDYIGQSLGFGALSGLFGAAVSDAPIGFKLRTETPPKRFLGKANRVLFWLTFTWSTNSFIQKRMLSLRREAEEFSEATDSFFEKVNECRAKNPYDMWIQATPGELQTKEFLHSLTNPPHAPKFPFKIEFKK